MSDDEEITDLIDRKRRREDGDPAPDNGPDDAQDNQASALLQRLVALLEDDNTMGTTRPIRLQETDLVLEVDRPPRTLRILTMAVSVPFNQRARVWRFLVALQQHLATRVQSEVSILQIRQCPSSVDRALERMFGWTPQPVWQWQVPAVLLPRGLGRLHAYLCQGRSLDAPFLIEDGTFDLNVALDHFLPDPLPNMEDVPTQPVANLTRFHAFFEQVKGQCRALGNAELGSGRELLVLTLTSIQFHVDFDTSDRLRQIMTYLFTMGRIMFWPLFVLEEVYNVVDWPVVLSRTERPRPLLSRLTDENYFYWVPQKKPLVVGDLETAVVVSYEDEEGAGPLPKQARGFDCVQCCQEKARFRAGFLPYCSDSCYRQYYS